MITYRHGKPVFQSFPPGNINYHDDKGVSQGHDSVGSTLHFGPGYPFDPYEKAHAEK